MRSAFTALPLLACLTVAAGAEELRIVLPEEALREEARAAALQEIEAKAIEADPSRPEGRQLLALLDDRPALERAIDRASADRLATLGPAGRNVLLRQAAATAAEVACFEQDVRPLTARVVDETGETLAEVVCD